MEIFNGLHVPSTSDVDMKEVQSTFCNTSNNCIDDDCICCLFSKENLNEFITWFNSNLNVIENDKKG